MKIIHISALHLQYKMQKDNPSVTKFKTGNSNRNTPFLFKHKRTSAPWKFSGTSPQEKQFQKHWALKYLGLCASKQRALQPRQKANRKQECWQASPARWGERWSRRGSGHLGHAVQSPFVISIPLIFQLNDFGVRCCVDRGWEAVLSPSTP